MIDLITLSLFISAVIVLSVTPGPDLFLILGRGVSQGRAAALCTALGFFLAGFVQVPMLAFGFARVVADNPVLFDLLRFGGGAYLIWRGIRMIRSAGQPDGVTVHSASAAVAIREGFVASLVNPKSHVFLLAFLPQFVRPENGQVMLQFIILGVVMRLVALIVEGGVAILAGSIGQRLQRSARLKGWLERLAGSLLIAIGLRLILMDRPQDTLMKP